MTVYFNAKNERIKRQYFEYLKEAKKYSISTIDNVRKSILRYEEYTKLKDFSLSKKQAIGFKKYLSNLKANRTGEKLSLSTKNSNVNNLKDFFKWLSLQKGYKSKISLIDLEYLTLSDNERRASKSIGYRAYPTPEQIRKVIFSMPFKTDIEKRDRALIAFTFLTACRVSAIASLKLKHIDVQNNLVKQDPKEVKTKTRKRIDSFFFPVGDDVKQVFIDWFNYLKQEKLYGNNDPLFPKTNISLDNANSFTSNGLEPLHWQNTTSINKIFKKSFNNAGLEYFNPHSFRKTIVNIGEKLCKTPEDFKAWSQNIGHESPLTTFVSYGYLDVHRQGDIIASIANPKQDDSMKAIIQQTIKEMQINSQH